MQDSVKDYLRSKGIKDHLFDRKLNISVEEIAKMLEEYTFIRETKTNGDFDYFRDIFKRK